MIFERLLTSVTIVDVSEIGVNIDNESNIVQNKWVAKWRKYRQGVHDEDLFIAFMGLEYKCEDINNCRVIKGTNKIVVGMQKRKIQRKTLFCLKI